MATGTSDSKAKPFNEAYSRQFNVLRAMSSEVRMATHTKQIDISTITELSGLADEKETQRCLYILEGHKLVAPHPAGDFTSKLWHITEEGLRAVKAISKEFAF